MSTVPTAPEAGLQPEMKAAEWTTNPPTFAVCLPSMAADAQASMLDRLRTAFPEESLLIATPSQMEDSVGESGSRLVPYPIPRTESEWVLNGADYLAAARLTQEHSLAGVLLLGAEAASLNHTALLDLRRTLSENCDLALPRYRTGPQEGLVNSALLYPLTRALFGTEVHFPLPLDAALSARMLSKLATSAQRAGNPGDGSLVWPVAEAATAGFTVREVGGIERVLPRPQEADLNVLFPTVTASLFADMENRASFWQRPRALPRLPGAEALLPQAGTSADREEIRSMIESFRLAFSNLREIWALVLPPQTLLALKKLSLSPVESFTFPQNVWARVVYDFGLAFHMRTLNRGHLLGAMTPLYLAWVASLLASGSATSSGKGTVEETARAFEQEKPYLVSRWRWPDRFNP